MARLVASAPGFVAAEPTRLAEVTPVGGEEFGYVVPGDLYVDGDVGMYDGEALIVLGDLHANAVSADETAHVLVAGTIHARTVWSEGFILAKDMDAELIYGSYEAGDLGVSGTARARAVVVDRHCFNVGRIEAEFVFHGDSHRSTPETQQQVERFASLVPAAMIDELEGTGLRFGRVNMRSLLRHVNAGHSVFA